MYVAVSSTFSNFVCPNLGIYQVLLGDGYFRIYVLNFEVFVYFYPFLEIGLQKLNREGNKFPGEI